MTDNDTGYMYDPFAGRIYQVGKRGDCSFPVHDSEREARAYLVDKAYKDYDDAVEQKERELYEEIYRVNDLQVVYLEED